MKCPECGHPETGVKDSRPAHADQAIRRRRHCDSCGARFTTFEVVATLDTGTSQGAKPDNVVMIMTTDGRLRKINVRTLGEQVGLIVADAFRGPSGVEEMLDGR